MPVFKKHKCPSMNRTRLPNGNRKIQLVLISRMAKDLDSTAAKAHGAIGIGDHVLKLAEGITLNHFDVDVSADGQCLLIYCADSLVAMHSAMGSDVKEFHFSDGSRYSLIELVRRLGELARGRG